MPFVDLPPHELVRYRSSVEAPADFDTFWAETLAEAATVPLEPQIEVLGQATANADLPPLFGPVAQSLHPVDLDCEEL